MRASYPPLINVYWDYAGDATAQAPIRPSKPIFLPVYLTENLGTPK